MADRQVRLTGTSYAVLSLLEQLGRATPYDLKQALERSVQNFWPVPHTTFYAEPERLARAGLLSEEREREGRRRKLYALTTAGREELGRWRDAPEATPPQLRDEGVLKLFAGGDPVSFMESHRDFYKAKLEELEGYLQACPEEERWRGVRASLLAGTTYHRELLGAMERYLAQRERESKAAGA